MKPIESVLVPEPGIAEGALNTLLGGMSGAAVAIVGFELGGWWWMFCVMYVVLGAIGVVLQALRVLEGRRRRSLTSAPVNANWMKGGRGGERCDR